LTYDVGNGYITSVARVVADNHPTCADASAPKGVQAADMLAWTIYRAVLNEISDQTVNPIAHETFTDFYSHRGQTFIEGGYNTKVQLFEWVDKAIQPVPSVPSNVRII
jgi:hypothetical protein